MGIISDYIPQRNRIKSKMIVKTGSFFVKEKRELSMVLLCLLFNNNITRQPKVAVIDK
jgi:hypothetical protein